MVTLVPVRENEGKVTKGKEKQAGNILIIIIKGALVWHFSFLFPNILELTQVLPKVMVAFVVYENEAISRIWVKIILNIFSC